jgi:serine/threonine protein kinase
MTNILLVDDTDDLRELMREALQRECYGVKAVANGKDAQEALDQHKFDLIILDWELPDMSGPDICSQFRKRGGTTPVLMLTGRKSINDKEVGFEAGADNYLTKPVHPREFLANVKALLRREAQTSESLQTLASQIPSDYAIGATIIDQYEVLSNLGRGAMGIVYKVRHKVLNKIVAIKMIKGEFLTDKEVLTRFEQEAKAASSLDHPSIIKVYDYGISRDKRPYLVMDYLEGTTFSNLLKTKKRFSPQQILPLFIKLTDALEHAHSRNIVHRDIKPGNIVLVETHINQDDACLSIVIPKIVDFGIAKILDNKHNLGLTKAGELIGSPIYASPEQAMGNTIDGRTDIYSLGCVLYEALTGTPPFLGESVIDTVFKRLSEKPPRFEDMAPDIKIPDELQRIVYKSLEREPRFRYQTMAEMKQDLQNLVACNDNK